MTDAVWTPGMAERFAAEMNEPLDADLLPYLEEGVLGTQLRHPLVYQVPLLSNGNANAVYKQKISALGLALGKCDYRHFVYLHERPYRLEAFKQVEERLTDEQYWELLSSIWMDTENQHQNRTEWRKLLEVSRQGHLAMMSERDQIIYRSLPPMVTIYRGCTKGLNEYGFSWTLEKDRAEFFAKRFNRGEPIVLEATIHRADVMAVLTGRNEMEVVCYTGWTIQAVTEIERDHAN